MVERRKTIRAALAVDNSKRNKECLRKPKTEQDEGKEREKKKKESRSKSKIDSMDCQFVGRLEQCRRDTDLE
jgi:hypothetical protein